MADERDQTPNQRPEAPNPAARRAHANSAAQARVRQQQTWVDLQVQQAIRRGDFDDLSGAGRPLDLGAPDDPDWWVRRLIEREQITGVLPPALQLRKDDAELEALLDRESAERVVREIVEDFNRRVVEARRQLMGGPPVVTELRDIEETVGAWRARRQMRAERHRAQVTPARAPRRWWRRGR